MANQANSRRRRAPARAALAFGLVIALGACVGSPGPVGNTAVPRPAKPVELSAYLGTWYEYGRY